MNCQICSQNPATVHITEIPSGHFVPEGTKTDGEPEAGGDQDDRPPLEQKHICETCAQKLNLPQMQVVPKAVVNIWKLLQQSAKKARKKSGLSCPDCGMSLAEFRSKGKLGCPKDYEIFQDHLNPLLQRIHNATRHTGRIPGIAPGDLDRMNRLTDLRAKLEGAIREEDYEDAARFRDEIAQIEAHGETIESEE